MGQSQRSMVVVFALAGAALGAGACLEPLVSDVPGVSLRILPPGTQLPHVSSNPDLARQIRVNDGLNDMTLEMNGGLVALKRGLAKGGPVMYWDFGDTSGRGALLYVLVRREGEALVPVAHPYVIDSMPGDPGYSPMWFIQHVVVTDRYAGEVLPSAAAIADAVELGLVEEPVPAQQFVDAPVVPHGTTLDLGMGVPPQATISVAANGYLVDMLMIGGTAGWRTLEKAGSIPKGDVHRLYPGNAVTAQKDVLFQNLDAPWTPAVRVIDCRVTPANPMDPATVIDDETELFTRDMKGALATATARVTSWTITTSTKNWPIYVPQGVDQ